jgi:PAS domain S-box-containing protein
MELLVVDDDLEVRQIVQRALDQQGVRISTAATGAEAIAHALSFPIDLVVLDLHLPDMSGLEVLEELRAVHPSVYVIMLTGAGGEADRVLGFERGADDYIVKPFSPRELAARVVAVLRRFAEPEPDGSTDLRISRSGYQLTSALRELATGLSSDAPDAVIVTTDDLRIQSFNEAAEALYGWSEVGVVGRTLPEVIGWDLVEQDQVIAHEQLLSTGRWYGEEVQRARDGSPLLVRSSKTVLRGTDGAAVGIISVNRPRTREASTWAGNRTDSDIGLDSAIRVGLPRGEFVVQYQPVVHLGTGELLGVEALVRWQHPDRGLLAPAEFIAVAERSGVIVDLGRVVLEEACRQAQIWREAGHHLYMAVNLSPRQLADPTLTDWIAEVMVATGMPEHGLFLEVTETALVQDLDQATAALHRLAGLGACVSIDDFGTGWASLTYLREFPVDCLKVDRVFVAGLGTGSRDETIVASMLSLGRDLDVAVIAEGIETEEQRAILLELGCEFGQGYLFGRPQCSSGIDRALASASGPS